MTASPRLTRWRRVAALTAASVYWLPALTLRLGEALLVLAVSQRPATQPVAVTDPALWLVGVGWLLQLILLPPLRLGRLAFEQQLAGGKFPSLSLMRRGFRRWGGAMAWRAHLWVRRWVALLVAMVPTALAWGYGSSLTGQGDSSPAPLVWLGLGGLLLPLGLLGAAVWLTRYAMAPLLVLEGCPAGAAMQLSARAMAGHRREYINFWGGQTGRLLACLAVVTIPFVLPALRRDHARWLGRLRQKVTIFAPTPADRGCILPSAPI